MWRTRVLARYRIEAGRKQRYLLMFNDIPVPAKIKLDNIEWAIKNLEREDRIVWYLRHVRANDLAELSQITDEQLAQLVAPLGQESVDAIKAAQPKIKRRLEKIVKAPTGSPRHAERVARLLEGGKRMAEIRNNLAHFIQNAKLHGYRSVLDYTFPHDASPAKIFDHLHQAEAAEQAKRPDDRLITLNEDETSFLKVGGWTWFLIDRETCEREGKAMRHCGNSNPNEGDQILSLREPVEVKRGRKTEKLWKPHATFILNDGKLGEMKGWGNSKPSAELHPYIVGLLKDPRIEHVVGGGYAPARNFSLKDLPRQQLQQLLRDKPYLDHEQEHEPEDDEPEDEPEDDEYDEPEDDEDEAHPS